MITVSIAGGSQPEILQLVKKALKEAEQPLQFIVFDTMKILILKISGNMFIAQMRPR